MSDITTLAGNIAHSNSPLDSLLLKTNYENQEALLASLDGSSLTGTIVVSEGHKHTGGGAQVLTWLELGSWRISTSLDTTDLASARINSTTDKQVMYGAFVLPSGLDDILCALRYTANSHDVIATVDFYAPSNLNSSLANISFTCPHPITNQWVLAPSTVSLAAIPLTSGLRLVYFGLQCRMGGGGHAHLEEFRIGY